MHGSRSNAATRTKENSRLAGATGAQQRHDIFVRAHAPTSTSGQWIRRRPAKWPRYALIFDTETTIDATQKLTFGCFRRCRLEGQAYRCVKEGLFHADLLDSKDLGVLHRYVDNPLNVPATLKYPPQIKLTLQDRMSFVRRVFWPAVQRGDLIVGFNLPFDLSRLAVKSTNAGKPGAWSLILSLQPGRKSGVLEVNRNRPRISIESLNSKTAFIRLVSNLHKDEWPNDPRFLDLRTLVFALRDKSYSLDRACKAFKVPGKLDHKTTGRITFKEMKYCREDVAASNRLLNAAKEEFNKNPIDLDPDEAYSTASISKSYLTKMHIRRPKKQFRVGKKTHGIAMQTYYGGRAECRIRRTPVPVVYTDFTSQYPTVNALLGNWEVLKASSVKFAGCTDQVRRLLAAVKFEDTFVPSFWKQLSFFALVKPDNDIFPVRTVYNGRTQNIGLNYLSSQKPLWYSGPDLIASILLNRKIPRVLKAIRMVSHGEQKGLRATNLGGMVKIDPREDDFFVRVVEQRNRFKSVDKHLAHFLKIVVNSGSYGLFVQVDTATRNKPVKTKVYCGDKLSQPEDRYIEKLGPWYFPPLASLITAGGRLLLAMLERSVRNLRGSYLFCDTDSMCIVGSDKNELVPCPGGAFTLNGGEAVRTLSLDQIKSIAAEFNRLNPYDTDLVQNILKIEDINYVDSNPNNQPQQLFGYAISSKRYALYTRTKKNISIVKASGHGLGYLFAPKEQNQSEEESDRDDDKVPEWVEEAWSWLLCKEEGLVPKRLDWLNLPAMMRMAMTSSNIMRTNRPEWLAPFNFFLFPVLSNLDGYPLGFDASNFKFITPFESDRKKWPTLKGINLLGSGGTYRIDMKPDGRQRNPFPESLRVILQQYLRHPEAKSLAPSGTPCAWDTRGLLRRAAIFAGQIIPVGKETDRHWDQGEDPSLVDFKVHAFGPTAKKVVAEASDRERWNKMGKRMLIRKSELAQPTVYKILEGQEVKKGTFEIFKRAIDG